MTTQANKTVQANYSETLTVSIVAEYQALIVAQNGDNSAVLELLSKKYGKTVPSIRAKLASLKVYVSDKKSDTKSLTNGKDLTKAKKEDIAKTISDIVGQELHGIEVTPKSTLLSLLSFLLNANKLLVEREDKINSLIAEMLAENEPAICDDLNDDD